MEFRTRSISCVLDDLTSKLESLPAGHFDRPILTRMILGLRVERATREPSKPTVVEVTQHGADTPWSIVTDRNLIWGVEHGHSVAKLADFFCRTEREVRERIAELGLAINSDRTLTSPKTPAAA